MVNAIIADDNKDLCIALANGLNVTKDIKVIEIIVDGGKVIEDIRRLKPDLIILDMKMPGKNGIQIIEEIEADDSIDTKVIVFSGEPEYVRKACNSNCVIGYIQKGALYTKEIVLKIQKLADEIYEKNIDEKIIEYLTDLGFSTTNIGTFLLRDCISLYLFNRKEDCKVKDLFKEVANRKVVNTITVRNNIQKSAKKAWDLGNQDNIKEKLKLGGDENMSPKKVITMSRYLINID